MEYPQNPYAPPKSAIVQAPENEMTDIVKVYSPVQGGLGTFLGGPLAGAYFIRANFQAMGDARRAGLAAIWGIAICAVFILVVPFLPAKLIRSFVPILNVLGVKYLIEKMQFTKDQIASSGQFTFHSNWRVVGIALLGFLVLGAIGIAEFRVLVALGIHGYGGGTSP